MQTTLLGLAIAFIIALVAALVGPYFIDWNQFRPQFEAEATRIIGAPVRVGGKRIPKGESVLCLLGSANHDPAVYPDHPERLDITRPNVRPLSFGGGIHFCLGAQLARIEAEIAISTLLRRLPDLRLDDAVNPEWRPTFVLRGVKCLPASW